MKKFLELIGIRNRTFTKKQQNLAVLCIVILLCLVGYLQTNYYWPFYDGRFESKNIPVKIANHDFVFLRNYIWSYKKELHDGVHLKMLLPDFAPMQRSNYTRFRKNDGTVNISIYPRKSDNVATNIFHKNLKSDFLRLTSIYCRGGITRLKNTETLEVYECEPYSKTLYTTPQKDFFILCDNLKTIRNPLCVNHGNQASLYGNLGLAFYFDAYPAAPIDNIYAFVRNFIETARIKGEK